MLTNCGNNIDVFQLHQGRNLFVDYKEISFQDKNLGCGYFLETCFKFEIPEKIGYQLAQK